MINMKLNQEFVQRGLNATFGRYNIVDMLNDNGIYYVEVRNNGRTEQHIKSLGYILPSRKVTVYKTTDKTVKIKIERG